MMKKKFWKRFFVFVLLFGCLTKVFADSSCVLVAKTFLNIGHNSTATGIYRKYSKKTQVINYKWKQIDLGSHGTELYVELQKKSLTGGKKVASRILVAYENTPESTATFSKVGDGTYRLFHSTRGEKNTSKGRFISDNVIISTED